jgi:hypothetical protein
MTTRPNFIDLQSQSHGPFGSGLPSPRGGLPSPRLCVAGEVPPELSPLDAFAAQSRLLAKQLEESNNAGNRMSRLPPLTIASSLNQGRPGYFRSISEGPSPLSPTAPPPGIQTEIETPGFRPKSVYPTVSGMASPMPPTPRLSSLDEEDFRGRRPPSPAENKGMFGARREQSPPSLDNRSFRTG